MIRKASDLEKKLTKAEVDKLVGKRPTRKDYQYTVEPKRENKDRK